MNRPYEMPFYPAPPVIGIVLNLVLTLVLVEFLVRTDPLALALSAAWIGLGVVTYFGLNRLRTEPDAAEGTAAGDEQVPLEDD
ncbi:hypothetical protein ACFQH8_07285 [Halomicroarcula sp. GCM10025710]